MVEDGSPDPRSVPIVRAACLVIVLWGLWVASSILLPIVLAAFLSILAYRPLKALHERGLPTWLSLIVVMLVAFVVLGGFGLLLGNAIVDFVGELPVYAKASTERFADVLVWLEEKGLDTEVFEEARVTYGGGVVKLVGGLLTTVLGLLSQFVLVLLLMAFMLLEGAALPKKLARAFGPASSASDLSTTARIMDQVYDYVAIKTWISALTGLLFGLATWWIGLDFPILWGMLAFALNFIPNIGSVLSLIPPAVLAFVTLGTTEAGMVVGANVLVNQVLGNVVEPKVMGDRLGLSPLVVLLSLLLWGALWGPVGMVLSVPLTMIVKIVMENSREWRAVGVLLGPADGGESAEAPA